MSQVLLPCLSFEFNSSVDLHPHTTHFVEYVKYLLAEYDLSYPSLLPMFF
uniref:Uncharacterized protein n=1 Tax=Aegilops tauschii subsp. strangulata TaxID=200361 RepID=A0A453NBH8_AEGTS